MVSTLFTVTFVGLIIAVVFTRMLAMHYTWLFFYDRCLKRMPGLYAELCYTPRWTGNATILFLLVGYLYKEAHKEILSSYDKKLIRYYKIARKLNYLNYIAILLFILFLLLLGFWNMVL